MDPAQAPDHQLREHLELARRLVALPVEATGMHWHPFGVYTIPMPKVSKGGERWSRRLHLWHPQAKPVGEASPYGVHTHTGTGVSHVLAGSLDHHLYWFDDGDGWERTRPDGVAPAALQDHACARTNAGITHTFPAHHAHGVTKPEGYAISLFEQRDEPKGDPFTTWRRLDVPPEELERRGPVPVDDARRDALLILEQALYAVST